MPFCYVPPHQKGSGREVETLLINFYGIGHLPLDCIAGDVCNSNREKAAQCRKGIALSLFVTIGKITFNSVSERS